MLLQSLTLENIRSYRKETITFPAGSCLLSGDIGSGKSSILHAIEFALFGTSRPDLPAEALLRKGTIEGKVSLTFILEGEQITINRALKKEKLGIKQLPGTFIKNGIQKELMPSELRAEMISLLGYPEDLLNKGKNYLFRYTVYCPQEEMKLILMGPPEVRLDILRKAFGLDKYKDIQENTQIYLRQLRGKISLLQAELGPLPACRQEQQEKKQFIAELQQKQIPGKEHLQHLQQKHQSLLLRLREKEQDYQQIQQQEQFLLRTQRQLAEQRQQLVQGELQKEELAKELASLPLQESKTITQVEMKFQALSEELSHFLEKKTLFQERRRSLGNIISEAKDKLTLLQPEIATKEEREKNIYALQQQLQKKLQLEEKKGLIEANFLQATAILAKHQALVQQAEEMRQKIERLDLCPTCLQQVPPAHKESFGKQQQEHIAKVQEILPELHQKLTELQQQQESVRQQLTTLHSQEHLLAKLELQQVHFVDKEQQAAHLLQQQEIAEKELQELLKLLEDYAEEKKIALQKQQQAIQQERYLLTRIEFLTRETVLLDKRCQELQGQMHQLQQEERHLREKIQTGPQMYQEIQQMRLTEEQLRREEQAQAILLAEQETTITMVEQRKKELEQQLLVLEEKNVRWHASLQISNWLETYFAPLTSTIEKHLFVAIYQVFSEPFQEWFSVLIDDQQMTARLDDAFTPIIESNGYEITFDNLSGGERTSAALAYRLALNHVLNKIVPTIKTKEILILDEPTDGFSSEQLDKMREVLERLQLRQIIIVSHEAKIESFVDKIIRISKEGQESRMF